MNGNRVNASGSGTEQIGELLRRNARRTPERVAFKVRGGGSRTYAELDGRTDRLANALTGLGLRTGDRVAAWMEDSLEYVELYLAIAKAGLVIAPINARFRAQEARFQLEDADPRALFVTPGLRGGVEELLASGALDDVRIVDVGSQYDELLGNARDTPPAPPDERDLFIVAYTSGTTGRPKGAMLTHRSVRALGRSNAIACRVPLGSVGIFAGSMSFVATIPAFLLTHMAVGGTIVMLGPGDVTAQVDAIEREAGTYTSVPAPRMKEFADLGEQRPESFRTLQCILRSASKAPPDDVQRMIDVFGYRYVEGWGMTENSGGLITATTRADVCGMSEALDLPASAGRPVMDALVDVVDDEGRALPHDGETVGELIAQTPTLMLGYWNQPEETARVLQDGWYHTGDLGTIDPAGYVYVSDRRTDLVVSGGMNVYPSEVEAVIAGLDGVEECVVFGSPHERWGQTVVAAVVLRPGAALTAEEVIGHCRATLATYKKPTRVWFLPSLPRNASGKVLREATREQVLRGGSAR